VEPDNATRCSMEGLLSAASARSVELLLYTRLRGQGDPTVPQSKMCREERVQLRAMSDSAQALEGKLKEAEQQRDAANAEAQWLRDDAVALKAQLHRLTATVQWLSGQGIRRAQRDIEVMAAMQRLQNWQAATSSATIPAGSSDATSEQTNFEGSPKLSEAPDAPRPDEKVADTRDAAERIKELLSSCMELKTTWWTFEVCSGKSVRQIRLGQAGHLLGQFHSSKSDGSGAYEEQHRGGDMCDEIGQQRSTTVRWQCGSVPVETPSGSLRSDTNKVLAYISDVSEPSPCNYLISIYTEYLC